MVTVGPPVTPIARFSSLDTLKHAAWLLDGDSIDTVSGTLVRRIHPGVLGLGMEADQQSADFSMAGRHPMRIAALEVLDGDDIRAGVEPDSQTATNCGQRLVGTSWIERE